MVAPMIDEIMLLFASMPSIGTITMPINKAPPIPKSIVIKHPAGSILSPGMTAFASTPAIMPIMINQNQAMPM